MIERAIKRVVIRRADKADGAVLQALEGKAFGEAGWGAGGLAGGFTAAGVEILLACEEENGTPAGFAIWRRLPGEAELLSIGVDPRARRRGVGASLLGAVIDAARAAAAEKVHLEVDPGNSAALALYGNGGFVEMGRRKAYYRSGADAVLMSLRL